MSDHIKDTELTLTHAREIYLQHLNERFRLLRYFIVVMGAFFAGVYQLMKGGGDDKLIVGVFLLMMFVAWHFSSLDGRLSILLDGNRKVMKCIEEGFSPGYGAISEEESKKKEAKEEDEKGLFQKILEWIKNLRWIKKVCELECWPLFSKYTGRIIKRVYLIFIFVGVLGLLYFLGML